MRWHVLVLLLRTSVLELVSSLIRPLFYIRNSTDKSAFTVLQILTTSPLVCMLVAASGNGNSAGALCSVAEKTAQGNACQACEVKKGCDPDDEKVYPLTPIGPHLVFETNE